MTANNTYVLKISKPETGFFIMPAGFSSNVIVYAWGAGGGSGSSGGAGSGSAGGGGGFASSVLNIPAGTHVEYIVGAPGNDANDSGQGAAGGAAEAIIGRLQGGGGGYGAPNTADGDSDGGWGGGGGGSASAILLNGNIALAAAGGGGGGGMNDDYQNAGNPGYPGGVQASPSGWYPVTLSYAWCSFMNNYAIWTGGFTDVTTNTYQTIVNFPTTDTYTFYLSTDNYGSITVDSTTVLSYSTFVSVGSATSSVTAGNHTIKLSITNQGGPSGIAAQILNSGGKEIWNSRTPINFPELNSVSSGGDGLGGWAGGGGGGGGYLGGLGGAGAADYYSTLGGSGGLNLGDYTESGNGTLCGGRTNAYYPTTGRGTPVNNIGNAGYSGYLVMIFTATISGYIKQSGVWQNILKMYYKLPPTRINVPEVEYIPGPPVNTTYKTVGTTTWTAPANVTSVTVTYPTPTGLVNTAVAVVPGTTYNITIGDFGQDSTFDTLLTAPAYNTQVFSYSGNVDNDVWNYVQIATATKTSVSTTGYNTGQIAAAAAAGIYYNVVGEGWHGDLYSSITITPVLISTLLTNTQVYSASGSGRAYPGQHSYPQQPSPANNFVMQDYQGDAGIGGEGGYSWTTNLQQQGYLELSYQSQQPFPVTVEVDIGGWKQLQNGWLKQNGQWIPLITNNTIQTAIETTKTYDDLVSHTWTVPAGVSTVMVMMSGGGGGGGGAGQSAPGADGVPGQVIYGQFSVTPGDVLTISPGGGGQGGISYTPPPAGGGGGCKIICTKLHELGYLPDHIYAADEMFGQWLRANDPYAYYGYVKWASVVVDWMENEGPQCMFWIRDRDKRGQAQRELAINWARRIATPWAEHMAYKMGVGTTDNRAGRMIMNTGMWISRLIGKYTKTTEPSKSIALGYVMWATFGVFWLLAGIK